MARKNKKNYRRNKGEGGVTPLSNGKYKVSLDSYHDGKRHVLTLTVEKSKIADAQMELRKRRDSYTCKVKADMYFPPLADSWLREKEQEMLRLEKPLKQRTYEGYKSIVERLKKELCYVKVCKINETIVNNLKLELAKIHKAASLRKDFFVLNQIIRLAMREHIVPTNPISNIALPRVSKQIRNKILSAEEVMAVNEELRKLYNEYIGNKGIFDWHLYPIFVLALDSGMRRGEIAGLAVEDIDFETGEIYVHTNASTYSSGKIVLGTPKTDAGTRTFYLSKVTLSVLKSYIESKSKANYKASPLLFSTRNGTPIDPNRISRAFSEVREKLGLNKAITFHALRHTAITRMMEQGTKIKTISAKVGHEDISTTLGVYTHVSDASLREAAGCFDELLEPLKKAGDNKKLVPFKPSSIEFKVA